MHRSGRAREREIERGSDPNVEKLLPTFPVFVFVFILLCHGGSPRGGEEGAFFLLELCRHSPGKSLRDKLTAMIRHAHQ